MVSKTSDKITVMYSTFNMIFDNGLGTLLSTYLHVDF